MPGSIEVQEPYLSEKKEIRETDKIESDEDTRKMERRVVRKLDMTLMPVVWILYFFNYMDRNNIA